MYYADMDTRSNPGLGELLRYVNELVEHGAEEHYRAMRLDYRARYTPVLRALHAGACTVTDITARTHLTQGAISQTVALLEGDGLVARHAVDDGRMLQRRSFLQLGDEISQARPTPGVRHRARFVRHCSVKCNGELPSRRLPAHALLREPNECS